jgi:N12 class adenine-specific DNA methylase/superfamily II DNA/RNA helicase
LSRATYLADLYKKSVQELTKSRDDWKGLLTSMARYYKYSFDKNVLIYVQRPDAGFLADMDVWNNQVGRRVNSQAKSVAVIDMSNPTASLQYLFDLMDTNGSYESFRKVMGYVWELENQYKPGLLMKFSEKYGTDTSSVEGCLYDLVLKRTDEILPKFLEGFQVRDQDSILYDLPIEAVKEQFSELVRDSAAYTVFKKCGLSTDMFEESSFENISHFNSLNLFIRIGCAAISIARPVLREINLEIENIKTERSRQYEERTLDRVDLYRGSGRDAIPGHQNFGEREIRPDGSREIRQTVEGIHDGTASPPSERADSRGQDQRDNRQSGHRGGEPQGNADPAVAQGPADAQDRGHTRKSEPPGDDLSDRRRDHPERSRVQGQISENPKEPSEEKEPSADGSFFAAEAQRLQTRWEDRLSDKILPLPIEEGTPSQERVSAVAKWLKDNSNIYLPVYTVMYHATDPRLPITDQGLLPTTAERRRSYQSESGYVYLANTPSRAKAFGDLGNMSNSVVYEVIVPINKLLADTDQLNNQRSVGQTVGNSVAESIVYGGGARVKGFVAPWQIKLLDTPAPQETPELPAPTVYRDEEIRHFYESILTDRALYPRAMYDEINRLYEEDTTLEEKAEDLFAIYTEYGDAQGENGIATVITKEQLHFYYGNGGHSQITWFGIANIIDVMRLQGEYVPYVPEIDDEIGDYDIPDELREMQGADADNTESYGEEPTQPALTREQVIERVILQGNITDGGKESIYRCFMNSQSKNGRVKFIRKQYGYCGVGTPLPNKGHFDWTASSGGIEIDYQDGALSFAEKLTWSRVETLISELIRQGRYLASDEQAKLLAADVVSAEPPESTPADEDLQLTPFESEPVETQSAPKSPSAQLSLFDVFSIPDDTYEVTDGEDSDHIITDGYTEGYESPFQVGDRISHEGRVFEIIRFLDDGRTVELGDVAQLQGLDSFKIKERLSVSRLNGAVLIVQGRTQDIQPTIPTVEQIEREDTARAIISPPEITERHNYRYSPDHHLYEGGPKTKCRNNIEAIRLLKELQAQNRSASAEEQVTLAKFVGWGGLANALTPGKSGWEQEYEEIKALLTEDEFSSAVESTTTAYYTEHSIIGHIYKALERFGFREGNVLDPGMGTGNFFSVLPESMTGSKLYGVELDRITGGIARQLYPAADIQVKGFEEINHPDHFFDVAIGNIPFNSIQISDRRYDKYRFRIHDYFIAKSLDKVRNGGIIAFITSKYTLDKANPTIRKYIAQRAELIGAIRLPNNAFKSVAGTEATTDIIFLQKREREIVPDEDNCPWLSVEENEDGVPVNSYFIDHPEMVLGKMAFDESMFGNEKTTACLPREGDNLDELLENAVYYLHAEYTEPSTEFEDDKETELKASIPADPAVRDFSYALVDNAFYYRENSRMYRQNITGMKAERIRGLLTIRSSLRALIDFQTNPYRDGTELTGSAYDLELKTLIGELNQKYDAFIKKYGYINSLANVIAFSKDSDAPLLRSIEDEKENEKGVFEKTAVFFKATIKPRVIPKSAETAEEALRLSLNMKGRVDLDYMQSVYHGPDDTPISKDEIISELGLRLYQDPAQYTGNPHSGWVLAEEYLSGYVRDKLSEAVIMAERHPDLFTRNVEALKQVQPTPLKTDEISFVLGSVWIPLEYYRDFMYEKFKTYPQNKIGSDAIDIEFSKFSGAYHVHGKGYENDSVVVNKTYGTERKNAYEILEDSLNLRTVEVKDRVEYVDPDTGEDKVKYVLNKNDTILARERQAQIKMEFESWLFADPERGARLTQLYNDRFNNVRPRVYNGDDLILPDMSEDIKLRKHQLDVIAHGIYGDGNLLVAHEVGAGKTFSACAIAYELRRIGAMQKPLITVPNHLVGQWASEYMRLYPTANLLVARKRDFEKKNRRRFVSRIATGDYDSVIMAHSSFELIGLSRERQLAALKDELNEITFAIAQEKDRQGKSWSLKQMEIFKKNLQYRYDRLFKAEKKDDVINFEQLGVDMLSVDEAQAYKNNYSFSKLRNVAGVSSVSSQCAMDMYMKCQYINELNDGRGVNYLTGTPISNSISEMYVLQKTLQPEELKKRDVLMFDAWVSTYAKVETSLEIRPEGNGYQMKNRLARFHNLPELMQIFSMVADIKTADMLDLPVPKLKTGAVQVIKSAITPAQKEKMVEFVMRAEAIRNGEVSSDEDNFLKLTSEARLVAVDPRILDPAAPNDPDTKLNLCARKVAEIYHETAEQRLTQLIFCDKGTPKDDGRFDFYNATRAALIEQGVKPEEIAFIHDAKSDVQREALFEKVRRGEIRILMGSTEKMGTGMNVQDRLVAVHHLDVPWRPSDLTQRNGRILRQGNLNEEVSIFNYITEETFDAYLWQILEFKQRYIAQIMTGRSTQRVCEDIDETVLQYAEFKALAVADPRIREKLEVDNEIGRLQVLKSAWKNQQNDLQYHISIHYPTEIQGIEKQLEKISQDIETYAKNKPAEFSMTLDARTHDDRTKAGEHLKVLSRRLGKELGDTLVVGHYAGFAITLIRGWSQSISIHLNGKGSYQTDMGESELGNITRIENLAERITAEKKVNENELDNLKRQLEDAMAEVQKPFALEQQLAELVKKKVQLDLALEFRDNGEDDILIDEQAPGNGSNDETPEAPMPKRSTILMEKMLYTSLRNLAPDLLDGKCSYMKFKSEGFEDLVLENIGGGEYSIAHYYTQDGDAMRDPEITFSVDVENKSVTPLSYLQDAMGIYYETSGRSLAQIKDLEQFWCQWMKNIEMQGFTLHESTGYAPDTDCENEECEMEC